MKEWRCFHCDEVFTDEKSATEHFGFDVFHNPACVEMVKPGLKKIVALSRRMEERALRAEREVEEAAFLAAPHGLKWIDEPVTVTGGDYQYEGRLLLSFPKKIGGAVRYIVRDQNNRLFIHNAQQIGRDEQ